DVPNVGQIVDVVDRGRDVERFHDDSLERAILPDGPRRPAATPRRTPVTPATLGRLGSLLSSGPFAWSACAWLVRFAAWRCQTLVTLCFPSWNATEKESRNAQEISVQGRRARAGDGFGRRRGQRPGH